jgi:hypothetical protein
MAIKLNCSGFAASMDYFKCCFRIAKAKWSFSVVGNIIFPYIVDATKEVIDEAESTKVKNSFIKRQVETVSQAD